MRLSYVVSKDWMIARKQYLTASKLAEYCKKLSKSRPEVKRMLARQLAENKSNKEPNPYSYDAAAMGHICEPHAIEAFNQEYGTQLYHWDDCIIHMGEMGFSPDALDIDYSIAYDVDVDVNKLASQPTTVAEVKTYEASHYTKCLQTEPMKLDERYQIAAAMYICPSITEGHLILFCPDLDQWSSYTYTQNDLALEIEEIAEVYSMWIDVEEPSLSEWKSHPMRDEIKNAVTYAMYVYSGGDISG